MFFGKRFQRIFQTEPAHSDLVIYALVVGNQYLYDVIDDAVDTIQDLIDPTFATEAQWAAWFDTAETNYNTANTANRTPCGF